MNCSVARRPRVSSTLSSTCTSILGSGFRVQGSGFRVQGSGCRVQGALSSPPPCVAPAPPRVCVGGGQRGGGGRPLVSSTLSSTCTSVAVRWGGNSRPGADPETPGSTEPVLIRNPFGFCPSPGPERRPIVSSTLSSTCISVPGGLVN